MPHLCFPYLGIPSYTAFSRPPGLPPFISLPHSPPPSFYGLFLWTKFKIQFCICGIFQIFINVGWKVSFLSLSSSFCLSVCLICIFFFLSLRLSYLYLLSVSPSVYLSLRLSYLSLLSVSLSVYLSHPLSYLSLLLSVWPLSIFLSLCLSVSPSVYLSHPLYICLTLCLSDISICLTRLIYVPMSLCLFIGYFFVCVFVCLSAWLFFISFRLPVASSAFLFVFIFFCMSPCLLVSLPACLSVFLSLRMSASFVLSYLSGKIVI